MPSIPRYYSDNVTQRSTFNMSSIFQYYSTFSFAHSFSIASKMETFTGIVLNIYFFWHGYTCLHSATFSLMEIFKSFWSVFKWFSYFSIWFLSSLQISAPVNWFHPFSFCWFGYQFQILLYIFFVCFCFIEMGNFTHPISLELLNYTFQVCSGPWKTSDWNFQVNASWEPSIKWNNTNRQKKSINSITVDDNKKLYKSLYWIGLSNANANNIEYIVVFWNKWRRKKSTTVRRK